MKTFVIVSLKKFVFWQYFIQILHKLKTYILCAVHIQIFRNNVAIMEQVKLNCVYNVCYFVEN